MRYRIQRKNLRWIRYLTSTIWYVASTIHYVTSTIRYVTSTIRYVTGRIRYVVSTIRYVPSTIQYVASTIRYVIIWGIESCEDFFDGFVTSSNYVSNPTKVCVKTLCRYCKMWSVLPETLTNDKNRFYFCLRHGLRCFQLINFWKSRNLS